MRILFVINNLGVGGAQKMVRYVYDELCKSSDYCKLAALFSRESINPSDNIIQLCAPRTSYFKALIALRRLLKHECPDIVCAFGSDAISLSYFASLGLSIKLIGSERNDPGNLPLKWRLLTKYVYPRCEGFSFQLEDVMLFYRMHYSEVVRVIPNAYLGKRYKDFVLAKDREKCITCVSARIDRQKGLDILLNAFTIVLERFPDYHLAIFGMIKGWEELTDFIKRKGISSNVVFGGPTDCLSDSIHSSRCFILPSRYEGIPNALIEAMASGVPCVATDCPPGGPRMLTDNGRLGLLCRVEDPKNMAEQICRLIEDDCLCDSLSRNAQTVQERFTAEQIADEWRNLFLAVSRLCV